MTEALPETGLPGVYSVTTADRLLWNPISRILRPILGKSKLFLFVTLISKTA